MNKIQTLTHGVWIKREVVSPIPSLTSESLYYQDSHVSAMEKLDSVDLFIYLKIIWFRRTWSYKSVIFERWWDKACCSRIRRPQKCDVHLIFNSIKYLPLRYWAVIKCSLLHIKLPFISEINTVSLKTV